MLKLNQGFINFSLLLSLFVTLSLLFAADKTAGIISLEDERKPREVAVAFYNVENLFDTINDPEKNDDDFTPAGKYTWNTERYLQKCKQLADVVAGIGEDYPMLVGLAEVENIEAVTALTSQAAISKAGYEMIHFESLDERGIDVALLYRKKLFKPQHIETLFVNLGQGNRPTRDILYVRGRMNGGPELHVFVNHWPSRYGGQEQSEPNRLLAASVLRKSVDAIITVDPNASILVMGDFNDYPDNRSLQEVLSAKGADDSGLLVNLMFGKDEELRGSYNYRGQWGFLDQIIVSRSMHEGGLIMVKPASAQAHSTPEMLFIDPKYGDEKPFRTFMGEDYQGGFSDHLPVKAVLFY